MKIIILGSGTSIPHPERASPGVLVQLAGSTILIDPSSGSLHRVERSGVRVKDIDFVLFSHYHPDHTGDLGPLLFALNNSQYFPDKRLTLIGPPGLQELHQGLLNLYGGWIQLEPQRLSWQEINEERLDFGTWSLRSLPVVHTDTSIGYRLSQLGGAVFAYSGDTDYCPSLIRLVQNADVALIEAAQPSHLKIKGHLTPRLAGQIARQADVKELVITHLYPVCDGYSLVEEIRSSGFQGRAAVAYDGMVIQLS